MHRLAQNGIWIYSPDISPKIIKNVNTQLVYLLMFANFATQNGKIEKSKTY